MHFFTIYMLHVIHLFDISVNLNHANMQINI